ncbi:hypothetical protein RB195_003693 [Necator americanus]|uniref:Uncharacterized protein n=1 Tax=Necator americanus TaxID=51031 RepID=A0ABR1DPQ0_NECAM
MECTSLTVPFPTTHSTSNENHLTSMNTNTVLIYGPLGNVKAWIVIGRIRTINRAAYPLTYCARLFPLKK